MKFPAIAGAPRSSGERAWRLPLGVGSFSLLLLVLACFLVLLPLGALVLASFQAEAGQPLLRNYWLLIGNAEIVWNTAVVSVGSTLLALFFGASLAWITTRTNIPLSRTLEQLLLIPFYMTPLIGSIAWVILAAPGRAGILNMSAMKLFGIEDGIFNIYSPAGIVWVMGLYYAPFCYLLTSGALKSMDGSLEECSTVLGASNIKTALRITMPLIKPAILSSTLLVFVLSVGQFGVPAVIGMPRGYNVLTTRLYQYVAGFDPDYAAAAALGLSLLAFASVGVWLQSRLLRGGNFTTVSGRGYRPRRIDVRGWRIPLFLLTCVYVLISVVLPLLALLWASLLKWVTADVTAGKFTLDNYRYILTGYPTTQIAILNSLFVSLVGASAVMLLSILIAWTVQRTRAPSRKLLEFVSMMPLGVPGMVFSLGLLWVWIRMPIVNIYGTIWILVVCFVTIFLPYGVRAVSSTLMQLDRSLEECAAVLGASAGRILRTVTAPLLLPGVWAGWTLVLVSIIKELSAPALLYNSKTVVLSVAVFDLYVSGSFTYVAAMSLIQAVILFILLFVTGRVVSARGVGKT